MPHGHPQGWAPDEIGLFVDSVLKGGKPLPRLGDLSICDGKASAKIRSEVPIASAQLHYTTDTGPWQKREWKSLDARLADGKITADLPEASPLVVYLTATDERGAVVSTEHEERPGEGR